MTIDPDMLLELAKSKSPELLEVDALPALGEMAQPDPAPTPASLDPRTFGTLTATEGGAVPDAYGVENEVRGSVDDIDANVNRAREMYNARQPAQSSGPGDRERYLLEMMQRPDENAADKAVIFDALLDDKRNRLGEIRGRQSEYDKNMLGARDADRTQRQGEQPADLATVEMLVRSGMSPEAAMQVTQNSPALRLAGQGGLNVDLKRRAQDIGVRETVVDEAGKTGRNMQNIESREQVAANNLAAKAKAKGKGGGGGSAAGVQKAKAAYLAARANVPMAAVEAYLATGEPGALKPADLEAIQQSAPAFDVIARDPKKLAALLTASEGREGRTPDANASTLANDVAKKQADPGKRMEAEKDLRNRKASLVTATKAWNSMSPQGKAILAKIGGGKGEFAQQYKKAGMSDADQVAAARLMGLANVLIQSRSGAAVSDGEWNRLADEMGFASGDYSVFNSPAKIGDWLRRMGQGYKIDEGATLKAYPGLLDRAAQ